MALDHQLRRFALAALIGCGIVFGALATPIVLGSLAPAAAQISEDAQIALEQYGSWRPNPRFGEVWVPNDVPPDWRPYAYGHWVYTDEWGWYWVSDDVEADWGWVVYHYGRWAFERGIGWFWVPGEEWAPAWVDWRYGDDYSGWAPLPPDDLIDAYEVEPAYWVFVPTRFIGAPRLRTYYVPVQRRSVILRSTHIVNRTFPVRGARLAVNPGISPAFVARVSGAPVATYRVRPRVFASTQGVAGAVPVRREELRGARAGRPGGPGGPSGPRSGPGTPPRLGTISVQRTTAVIQPNAAVTAPQPLGKNEPGRLGTHPPRAAQGTGPTPSVAPLQSQPPAATPPPPPKPGAPTPPPGSGLRSGPPPTTTAPTTTAPTTTSPPVTAPTQPLERRDLRSPGGTGPQPQPNIVRPIPPQAPPPPPPPPPQERRVQPPPPPPPPQQRQVQPPPPPAAHPPPPPPAARAPAPPPPPPRQGPPPKKPPPKPGEKPPEPPK